MAALVWILAALVVLSALYLWLVAPARSHPDASALTGWLYAHRGLHDQQDDATENSLKAFALAAEHGYGIELDVQHTKDGKLVVCHDRDLKRVCGVDRRILDLDYDELCRIPLPDGTHVPLFQDVLSLVDGRVPLIVEIKHYGSAARNAAAALDMLRGYQGAYCVESFHPLAVRYFRKHAPDIVRGQLVWCGRWNRADINAVEHFSMKHLLVNALGRPHFIACSVPSDHTLGMWLMKHYFRPLLAAWTIRDPQTLASAQKEYDYPIFEGFMPQNTHRS